MPKQLRTMDVFSKQKRSEVMSRIRGADTKLEILVRKELFRHGFRYRTNDRRFPGKPDIVLPRYRTMVFIHGCFWHSHQGCRLAVTPKTRTDFWMAKLQRNRTKDAENESALKAMGWRVVIVWECQIEDDFARTIQHLIEFLKRTSE